MAKLQEPCLNTGDRSISRRKTEEDSPKKILRKLKAEYVSYFLDM